MGAATGAGIGAAAAVVAAHDFAAAMVHGKRHLLLLLTAVEGTVVVVSLEDSATKYRKTNDAYLLGTHHSLCGH